MEIGGDVTQWLWGVASAAQLGLGIRSFSKGYAGDSRFMPLKAFAVASLFVGSAASASVLILRANGIHKFGAIWIGDESSVYYGSEKGFL